MITSKTNALGGLPRECNHRQAAARPAQPEHTWPLPTGNHDFAMPGSAAWQRSTFAPAGRRPNLEAARRYRNWLLQVLAFASVGAAPWKTWSQPGVRADPLSEGWRPGWVRCCVEQLVYREAGTLSAEPSGTTGLGFPMGMIRTGRVLSARFQTGR